MEQSPSLEANSCRTSQEVPHFPFPCSQVSSGPILSETNLVLLLAMYPFQMHFNLFLPSGLGF